MIVSSPAGTNVRSRHAASSWSLPAESVNPDSLAVVMKAIKEAVLANGTIEPTLDEIEAEYQFRLALRCSTGLQLPSFTIGATSPAILNALNVSGLSQLTEASDYWLAGITNVAASHSGSLSSTGFTTYRNAHKVCWTILAQTFKWARWIFMQLCLIGTACKLISRLNKLIQQPCRTKCTQPVCRYNI